MHISFLIQTRQVFFIGEINIIGKSTHFSWKFEVKNALMMDLFLASSSFSLDKMLINGLEWCGLLVDYCDVFITVWTLILMAPIHCRGSIGEQVM